MTEQGYDGTETLFGTNAGRAAFADAGRAMRASLDAALTADPPLVQTEWKVLAAVLQETGTYSRVRSRLSVRALSLRTRVPFETARAAVDRLQAVGAIAFLARGPGKTPIVSLQTARPQAANPRGNRASSGGESARQPAGDPDSPARPQAANPRGNRASSGGESARDEKYEESSKPARERDPLWDALLAAFDVDPRDVTDGYRGRANKALGQLRKIGAKPEEIAPMLAEGRRQRASWNWTEIALANHWPTLKASLKARPAAAPAATASGDDEVIARCEHGVAMEELASCEPCSEAKARAIAKARDALRTASRGIALERQAS